MRSIALLSCLLLLGINADPITHSNVVQNLERKAACASVHIFVARGSTEAQGEGQMGTVASKVKTKISGADSEAIVYPATLSNYQSSENQGTGNMTKQIKAYVDRCPNAKIVLMGWSQGGQVSMDTICGTSSSGFTKTNPLDSKYAARSGFSTPTTYQSSHLLVYAVVPFGEPTFALGQSWDAGTATKGGIFPRVNNAACNSFASRIRSYCDANDEFCDSGNSLAVHGGYFSKYGDAAANWVVSKVS